MERFVDAVNWLSDMDSGWWPFLFLRPEAEARITNRRVLALALLYGLFAGMVANVALALAGDASKVSPLTFPLCATLGFFAVYRATFAYCWNVRADRMSMVPRAPEGVGRVPESD